MSSQSPCPQCGDPVLAAHRTFCSRSCASKHRGAAQVLHRVGDQHPKWRGGLTRHPLISTYKGMLSRCYTLTTSGFENYGGRGIEVCQRWREDFWHFVTDMGERPPGTTLDRIDNDGPYSPENCRWATRTEQNNNRRRQANCNRGHDRSAVPLGRPCPVCQRDYNRAYYLASKGGTT